MEYIAYYDEIVTKRESCRSFAKKAVEEEKIDQLRKYFDELEPLVDGIAVRMEFFDEDAFDKLNGKVGYNGFLIKAPKYMVLFSESAEHYGENAGYIMQGLTLKMTQLGLDACCQTIIDEAAAREALGSAEEVAAVVAFGYCGNEAGEVRLDIVSPSNVKMIKSGTKAAPKISLSDMAYEKTFGNHIDAERLYVDLEYAIRAACHSQSFFNRQPYRIIVSDSYAALIGLEDEMTNGSDEALNYGIVMFNFAAVLGDNRPTFPKWTFDKPADDLRLPENAKFVAMCRV